MKCIQLDWSSGRLDVTVRSFTSAVEMLPVTFRPLSTTATELKPSLFISVSASARGLSALSVGKLSATGFLVATCSRQILLDGNNLL